MKITLFAKKKLTKEGKPFTVYIARLTKKTGESVTVRVKFAEPAVAPKSEVCPCIIEADKADMNMTTKDFVRKTGEVVTSSTLWVSKYVVSDEKYVDHSMDDFV